MGILLNIAKFTLSLIYFVIKIFPTRNKVVFLSRQSDKPSIDFKFLAKELQKQNKDLKVVMLTKRIGNSSLGKLEYAFHMWKQMYHVATSKVAIIDGYQIVISVLKHKKKLKVIQIWHALGCLKKFGYSIADKAEGSKKEIIQKMNMHKNYDIVLASSMIARKNFAEAFNVSKGRIEVIGLPRIDFLKSEECREKTVSHILAHYPNLNNGKKQIVYVPTFRKTAGNNVNVVDIVEKLDYSKYNLIVKLHHDKELVYIDSKDNVMCGNIATGMEFLHLADYVITDYSAISFEALIARKPVYFYVYDFEKYKKNRDMYIDLKKEMPGIISEKPEEILNGIYEDIRDEKKEEKFLTKYVSVYNQNNTEKLAKYISKWL